MLASVEYQRGPSNYLSVRDSDLERNPPRGKQYPTDTDQASNTAERMTEGSDTNQVISQDRSESNWTQ